MTRPSFFCFGCGAGSDVMAGGAGHDIFVFDGGGGNDVILDFTPGEDLLQVSKDINGLDISSPEDLASRVTQVGGNVVIDFGHGDTLTLVNADAEDIQANPNHYFTIH